MRLYALVAGKEDGGFEQTSGTVVPFMPLSFFYRLPMPLSICSWILSYRRSLVALGHPCFIAVVASSQDLHGSTSTLEARQQLSGAVPDQE